MGTFLAWLLGLPRRLLVLLLRGYQLFVSPLFPPVCRFTPTCSHYAVESVERFGVLRGGLLATWRVVRCHPLNPGGHDPVPERWAFPPPRPRPYGTPAPRPEPSGARGFTEQQARGPMGGPR